MHVHISCSSISCTSLLCIHESWYSFLFSEVLLYNSISIWSSNAYDTMHIMVNYFFNIKLTIQYIINTSNVVIPLKTYSSLFSTEKPCFLKTGVKPGEKFGFNFYICGNRSERCSFVKPIRYVNLTSIISEENMHFIIRCQIQKSMFNFWYTRIQMVRLKNCLFQLCWTCKVSITRRQSHWNTVHPTS